MNSTIKNIIFDLGQVLLDLDKEMCLDAFHKAGFSTARKLLESRDRSNFFDAYECGDLTSAEFRDAVRKMCTSSLSDSAIDKIWNSMLVSIPEEKLQLLQHLRKTYKVCLLSNTNEIHWNYVVTHIFGQYGIKTEDCFEHIFLSYRMSEQKPHPAIYRKALEAGNMKPEETLFIDDMNENCLAAAELGIHAIHFIPGTSLTAAISSVLPNF